MRQRYGACLLTILGMLIPAADLSAGAHAFGDRPLDERLYEVLRKDRGTRLLAVLPAEYDARREGIVTPAKDQGACGACWAFASTAAVESHLLKAYGFGPVDLSEQEQISCNAEMAGCCGGTMQALLWWMDSGPALGSSFAYREAATECPTESTVLCRTVPRLPYRVINLHTVAPADFKTSLHADGPSYWRFDVRGDFLSFWDSGRSGDVYISKAGYGLEGGHAVQLIGWDDARQAYLCKNSWGENAGPNGDGTFWIAYAGHYYGLRFQMANFSLSFVSPESDGMWEFRMDNTDPGQEAGPGWTESPLPGAFGNNTVHVKERGAGSSCFRYLLPVEAQVSAGIYSVYGRWPAQASSATNTRYRVHYRPDAWADVRVNQAQDDARWVMLGTWNFATPRPVVEVWDDADGAVCADGIRFVRLAASPAASVTVTAGGSPAAR